MSRRSLELRPGIRAEVPADVYIASACEDKYCDIPREFRRCPHYCESHCCDYVPLHPSDFAKFFARNEPRHRTYRRCNTAGCTDMRVRTCKMYCRDHCCWGFHHRKRVQLTRKFRRKCRENIRAETRKLQEKVHNLTGRDASDSKDHKRRAESKPGHAKSGRSSSSSLHTVWLVQYWDCWDYI